MHAMKLWTFTLLLVLLGCASVLGSDLARENKHKCHWRRPKFCGDLDCPPYCVEKTYDDYEVRTYRKAYYITTQATDETYENAYLRGTHHLRAYFQGKNSKYEQLRHTVPVVANLHVNKDGASTARNYTFAMYLPDGFQGRHGHHIPAPLDPSVRVIRDPAITCFVRPFGGFATEAAVLNAMNELANALDDDRRDYEERSVWVGVYDAPWKLTDRYNEVGFQTSRASREA